MAEEGTTSIDFDEGTTKIIDGIDEHFQIGGRAEVMIRALAVYMVALEAIESNKKLMIVDDEKNTMEQVHI